MYWGAVCECAVGDDYFYVCTGDEVDCVQEGAAAGLYGMIFPCEILLMFRVWLLCRLIRRCMNGKGGLSINRFLI